jgi:tetratricopeptide (TPR) repeat protein
MAEHVIDVERAEQELLACAARVAEAIDGQEDYAEVIGQIAVQFARQDEFELGVQLADSIGDPYLRDQVLADIAVVSAAAGDRQYAVELIDSLDDYSFQTLAKARIAVSAIEKDDLAMALEFANQLDDPSGTLADIAIRLAKKDRFEEGVEVAESAEFAGARAWAFTEFANRYLELERKEDAVEMLDRALDAAEELDLTEDKVTLWQDIIGPLYGAGQDERAASLLDESAAAVPGIESETVRDQLNVRIIEGYAMMGRYDRAEELTETLEEPLSAVSAMTKVAGLIDLEADEGVGKQKAHALLDEAWRLLNETTVWEERNYLAKGALAGAIATAYFNLSESDLALEIASKIETPVNQAESLFNLAIRFYFREDIPSAFRAIDLIAGEYPRLIRWMDLRANLIENHPDEAAQALQRAEATAAGIEFPGQKAEAYARIAMATDDAERKRELLNQVVRIASEIKQPRPQAVALMHAAQLHSAAEVQPTTAEKELLRDIVIHLK